MKKNFLSAIVFATGLLFGFSACSEDSTSNQDPTTTTTAESSLPSTVLDQFYAKYPAATNVTWETKDQYYVASFNLATTRSTGSTAYTAWFSKTDGAWGMTETEIAFSALPTAVQEAYAATEYGASGSAWTTDQTVDYLQRPDGSEEIYVIEASKTESGVETDADLYYTAAGILLKVILDAETESDHSEYLPQETATTISQWLSTNFPNATIAEIDVENGVTEVEIINDGWKIDVVFDASQQWVYTKTEYDYRGLSNIPTVVLTTLRSSSYYTSDAAIDDADKYETRDNGTYYAFELETAHDNEVNIYIDETGTLLNSEPQNTVTTTTGTTSISVDAAIQTVIDTKYSGATILSKEYDDGYLEVEILHDSLRKTLKFNGNNEWVKSEWEVTTLPAAVTATITAGGYTLDDNEFDYEETSTYAWYEVDVRKGGVEYTLYISADGTIQRTERDD